MNPSATVSFASVYDTWFAHVCRWLHAHGIPASEREDVAQEVFVVAARKLADFDGHNVAGWLYRIAQLTASDHRKRAWFKNLFQRRREIVWELQVAKDATPEQQLEHKQTLQRVGQVIASMDHEKRSAFVLFEIEGYSGEEIANLENIQVATVWTRLHYARKEFAQALHALAAADEMHSSSGGGR